MRFILWIFLWFIYFPLMRLLVLLLFWNSKIEERERFEKKNKFERLALSFKESGEKADLAFEFSSEGEFQQAMPLIEDALKAGKKLELIFFSPSVEKGVLKLAQSHPRQIRYLRYPLVRIFPFIQRRSFSHWITAKTLVMVRYDLFPEFLLWSMKPGNSLHMIWVTFKKERSRGSHVSWFKLLFYRTAARLVFAVDSDLKEAQALGLSGKSFDFRIEQIHRRLVNRSEKFRSHFPLYESFLLQLSSRRLIIGNAWPSDLFLLRDLPHDYSLVVVPHQLSPEILQLFRDGLKDLGRNIFEINDTTSELGNSSTFLISKKGILCELYADFSHAYVGGGFEGSVHSLLEPLISGSSFLACGPRHERSTEFELALEQGRMTEVNTPEQFRHWLDGHENGLNHVTIKSDSDDYEKLREFVISC